MEHQHSRRTLTGSTTIVCGTPPNTDRAQPTKPGLVARVLRTIEWASKPATKKPQTMPGLELELRLIVLYAVIGVLYVVL